MTKTILALLATWAILLLSWCVKPVEVQVQNYVWKTATCQNLYGKVTEQSWQYIYMEWTGTSYDDNTDTSPYKWRQHVSECYFEPQTKEEQLQDAQMRYDGIFQDDKWFACRQHVSAPIKLMQRWQCEKFVEIETDEAWYMYECDIRIDEFSSYPVFCI